MVKHPCLSFVKMCKVIYSKVAPPGVEQMTDILAFSFARSEVGIG